MVINYFIERRKFMAELRKISNDRLCIAVSDHGAELSSIYDKKNNYEVLWTADSKYWGRHAPVLFPIVGGLYHKEMCYKGKTYTMGQHGFARDNEFALVRQTENEIVHEFHQTDATKTVYPFDFTLTITHTMKDNDVIVTWDVQNDTDGPMYFSIGGHPAFNVPPTGDTPQTDFYLYFGGKKQFEYIGLDMSDGTAVPDTVFPYTSPDGIFPITEHMFDKDALVFEDGQIEEVSFLFPDRTPYLTMHCKGFPYFGIWQKPGAPFICLEPWCGRTDDSGFTGELPKKAGICKLEKGESFHIQYSITIH